MKTKKTAREAIEELLDRRLSELCGMDAARLSEEYRRELGEDVEVSPLAEDDEPDLSLEWREWEDDDHDDDEGA